MKKNLFRELKLLYKYIKPRNSIAFKFDVHDFNSEQIYHIWVTFTKGIVGQPAYIIPCRFEHKMNLISSVRGNFHIKSDRDQTKGIAVWRPRYSATWTSIIWPIIITDFVSKFYARVNYTVEIAWHLLFWRCRFDVKQTHVISARALCASTPTSRASICIADKFNTCQPHVPVKIRLMVGHGIFNQTYQAVNCSNVRLIFIESPVAHIRRWWKLFTWY